jgi:hypothetical protein
MAKLTSKQIDVLKSLIAGPASADTLGCSAVTLDALRVIHPTPCAPTHRASQSVMTFAECLDILGWSARHAARELAVSEATARRWRDGQEPPAEALAWVRCIAEHRLAHQPPPPGRARGRPSKVEAAT